MLLYPLSSHRSAAIDLRVPVVYRQSDRRVAGVLARAAIKRRDSFAPRRNFSPRAVFPAGGSEQFFRPKIREDD